MTYNWDLRTDQEMFYYVLGTGDFIVWCQGWEWSSPTYHMPHYIYFQEEEE